MVWFWLGWEQVSCHYTMTKPSTVLLLLVSLLLTACEGSDPVTPDPFAGRTSRISAFYTHTGETIALYAEVADTAVTDTMYYGSRKTGAAKAGEKRRIVFNNIAGELVAQTDELVIDTNRAVWGIYTGSSADKEAFGVSTPKLSLTTLAAVQFIHASKNAPKARVKLEAATGSPLHLTTTEYRSSSGSFVAISPATAALVVVDEQDNPLAMVNLTSQPLKAGKHYTVVLYGSTSGGLQRQLTASIFEEP